MTDTKKKKARILIIDDEPQVLNLLSEILCENYLCATAGSAEEALPILQKQKFDLVISDINLGRASGIELIPRVLESSPDTVVMMISGNRTIDSAIEAMRVGAFDYIKKPFEIEHIELAVRRALNHHALLEAKRRYENNLEELVRQRTEQLNYLAYHDALTDLPNRALFEDRLSQALTQAQHNQKILAVALLSLDRFKNIHDTLGNTVAVETLREISERLKKCVGETETIARFEGEEFALLLTQLQDNESLVKVINEIEKSLAPPVVIDGNEIFITFSIGISFFPDDGGDAQSLLKHAGAALSRAKEQSGNSYQFYMADMKTRAMRRLELENKLRRALEREEFEAYYQPKIDTTTRQIIGMEALIRWHHPELGLVAPAEFIPLAEETGLIIPIGEWILRAACAQNKAWQEKGFSLQVSVNLSTRQFQPNLPEIVDRILQETKLAPQYLELEVTESSIMKNAEFGVNALGKLRDAGIKISIDDFGTGYSSFGYLKRLPIDALKVDRTFISDVTTNPDDAALVMAIITLAHNLGLKIVAEGVETEEQLRFLRLLRCDAWQGYLYSKPITADDFEKLLLESGNENGRQKRERKV